MYSQRKLCKKRVQCKKIYKYQNYMKCENFHFFTRKMYGVKS